mmetsp:Transcript_4665/g.6068  ORF Transcript_4665/g.6068 Transcript_4665/m.6068 type:complete len:87 (+) Transcript_4665:1060-1320(+)
MPLLAPLHRMGQQGFSPLRHYQKDEWTMMMMISTVVRSEAQIITGLVELKITVTNLTSPSLLQKVHLRQKVQKARRQTQFDSTLVS